MVHDIKTTDTDDDRGNRDRGKQGRKGSDLPEIDSSTRIEILSKRILSAPITPRNCTLDFDTETLFPW